MRINDIVEPPWINEGEDELRLSQFPWFAFSGKLKIALAKIKRNLETNLEKVKLLKYVQLNENERRSKLANLQSKRRKAEDGSGFTEVPG